MNFRVIIDEVALQEAQEAYDYYEFKQTGLGEKFIEELDKSVASISENPEHNRKMKNEIRQSLLYRFPYVVVYEKMNDVIVIYSIFHTSRNPKKKIKK